MLEYGISLKGHKTVRSSNMHSQSSHLHLFAMETFAKARTPKKRVVMMRKVVETPKIVGTRVGGFSKLALMPEGGFANGMVL